MTPKVLVLSEHYIPSVKGGGPIQSIKNLVDNQSNITLKEIQEKLSNEFSNLKTPSISTIAR